ncbi:MAG: hypothetical protein LWW85_03710 [Marinilabiliales bacterium]|nr:hypothetical protein [Marinilabiliales bacterium]
MRTLLLTVLLLSLIAGRSLAQSPEIGKEKHLFFHDIRTDAHHHIVPWNQQDPAASYDEILHLCWNYWKNMPCYWMRKIPDFKQKFGMEFPPLYLLFRTHDPADMGIGGDQFAMMLSSFNLWYDYTGDQEVLDNMIFQANWYLDHGLSASTALWPDIPYPCNTEKIPVYDGDLVIGKGFTQPDKAGSFGYELVMLFKKTGNRRYLEAAVKIANTLARHTTAGDKDHSPMPFKVHTATGAVGTILTLDRKGKIESNYTSNWTGTLRLYQELIRMKSENSTAYQNSFELISKWLQSYPLQNNRWGPFFEDIDSWSDTQINAGTMASFILDNPDWVPDWKEKVRGIQKWVIDTLGIPYWQQYGVTVIGEQTAYIIQGQSHTSRNAAIELRYAELTGDTSRVTQAIRQLNWCTYAVDVDGKNRWTDFDSYELWWTDGYGDFIRHYLRGMAAFPEIATGNHLLRSSSVIRNIRYEKGKITYLTFDSQSTEKIRLESRPKKVVAGTVRLKQGTVPGDHWEWTPLHHGGVLEIRHTQANEITVIY